MKKVIFAAAILLSGISSAFAQSNSAGTVHVGLGYGAQLGGATLKSGGDSEKGAGVRGNYGIRASYGVANRLSLGLYLRKEGAAYAISGTNGNDDATLVQNVVSVGFEPKFYVVNKDKFNLYIAPSIGYVAGKTYDNDYTSEKYTTSGVGYGGLVGFNWYWAKYIGMSVDLGYSAVSTTVKTPVSDAKLSGGGIYFGVGLVSKFGGK